MEIKFRLSGGVHGAGGRALPWNAAPYRPPDRGVCMHENDFDTLIKYDGSRIPSRSWKLSSAYQGVFMELVAEHRPGTLHRIVPRIEAYACMRTILTHLSSMMAPEYLLDRGNTSCGGGVHGAGGRTLPWNAAPYLPPDRRVCMHENDFDILVKLVSFR